jgi:hypothetical protein
MLSAFFNCFHGFSWCFLNCATVLGLGNAMLDVFLTHEATASFLITPRPHRVCLALAIYNFQNIPFFIFNNGLVALLVELLFRLPSSLLFLCKRAFR